MSTTNGKENKSENSPNSLGKKCFTCGQAMYLFESPQDIELNYWGCVDMECDLYMEKFYDGEVL